MTLKHISFHESATMRELERLALKEGTIKPEIVKEASAESFEPTSDLLTDMLKLAKGLRLKGFPKHAEELEQKILSYKLAETHLYHAVDESFEDLLQFAHPKKVKIMDAENEHGVVEDLLSTHKKMVDIARKEPTDKYASVLEGIASDLGIKKKANSQINEYYNNIKNIKNNLIEFIKSLEQAKFFTTADGVLYLGESGSLGYAEPGSNRSGFRDFFGIPETLIGSAKPLLRNRGSFKPDILAEGKIEKIALEIFKNATGLTGMGWELFLKGDPDWSFNKIVKSENLEKANEALSTFTNELISKLSSLYIGTPPNIERSNEITAALQNIDSFNEGIKKVFDKNSQFAFKILTNFNGENENRIREFYIPNMIEQAKLIKSNLEMALSKFAPKAQPQANQTQSEPDSAWWARNVAGKFSRLSNVATDNKALSAELKRVANILSSNAGKSFLEIRKLLGKDYADVLSIQELDKMIMKWENYYKNAKKASLKSNIKIAQNVFTAGPPVAKPEPLPNPNQGGRTVSRKPSSLPANNDVIDLQYAVHAWATALEQYPKIATLAGLDSSGITKIIRTLRGTGPGDRSHVDAPDGRWGRNTEKALTIVRDLINRIKKNNPEVIKNDVNLETDAQYNVASDEVSKKANSNKSQLYSALQHVGEAVGATNLVPENERVDTEKVYDKLPSADLSSRDSLKTFREDGNIPIKDKDLLSFNSLREFLTNNNLVNSVSYDKIKNELVEGLKADDWENVLNYLKMRSGVSKNKLAEEYQSAVNKLHRKLQPLLEKFRSNPYSAEHGVITAVELDSAKFDKLPSPQQEGRSQSKPQEQSRPSDGSDFEPIEESQKVISQPIKYVISLRDLYSNFGGVMHNYNNYANYLSGKMLHFNDFKRDPSTLIGPLGLIGDPSWSEVLKLNNINPGDKVVLPDGNKLKINYYQLGNTAHPIKLKYLADAKLRLLAKVILNLGNDLARVSDMWERMAFDNQLPQQSILMNRKAANAWNGVLTNLVRRITRELQSNWNSSGPYTH